MKKAVLIFAFMAMAVLSCSKDDEPTPTPTPTPEAVLPTVEVLEAGYNETTLGVVGGAQNGAMVFNVKATAEDGFKSLEIFKIENETESEYETLDENHPDYVEGNTQNYTLNYIFTDDDVDKALEFKAVVTDANDATAEIYFAPAKVKKPLLFYEVALEQNIPLANFNADTPCFLRIDDGICENSSVGEFYSMGYDNTIAMVFSFNDGSGFYLGSPAVVDELESNVTNGLSTLATTKFKELEDLDWYSINSNETFTAINAYEEAGFNAHEQKLEAVHETDKVFGFKTDDDRIGLGKINNFSTNSPQGYLAMDIYITQ